MENDLILETLEEMITEQKELKAVYQNVLQAYESQQELISNQQKTIESLSKDYIELLNALEKLQNSF